MTGLTKTFVVLVVGGLIMAQAALAQFPWSASKEAAPAEHRTGSITWKTDLDDALKTAREKRKLVFVHFSGTHCPPCRSFEEKVLSRNDVAVTLLSKYIPVFVVVEQSEELVGRLNVTKWPTDVFLDSEGREIGRQVSPQDPREFIKRVSMLSSKHLAGQSTTIANVRAAVAADATESAPEVQQTAAEDRKPPRETHRAESKMIVNPHTRTRSLPPIVARNETKTPSAVVVEEEGFSPPEKRRAPPIVRKSRSGEGDQVAMRRPVARPMEEAAPDEEETDVAPWRKSGKVAEPAALDNEEAHPAAEQSPEKVESTPEDPASEQVGEAPAQEEAPAKATDAEAKSEAVESESASAAKEEPNSQESPVESPAELKAEGAKRSRFGSEDSAEVAPKKASEVPVADPTETIESEALPAIEEKAADEKSAEVESTAVEQATEPSAEQTEPTKQEEVQPEVSRARSRFSAEDEAVQTPEAGEKIAPKAEAAPGGEASAAAETPDETTAVAGEPAADKQPSKQEVKDAVKLDLTGGESESEEPEVPAAQPEAPVASAKAEAEPIEESQPKAEEAVVPSKPAATKPSAKKPAKPKQEPAKETAGEDELKNEEPKAPESAAKSELPRGLAKIARSGKYVLGGNCCVALVEQEKLVQGNPKIGAIHRGRIYLFHSADARKKFLENPDDYSPVLSGYDPVIYAEEGQLVEGSPKVLAVLDGGRLVSFSSEETYNKFAADYKKLREKSIYVEAVRTAMKETNGGRHFR